MGPHKFLKAIARNGSFHLITNPFERVASILCELIHVFDVTNSNNVITFLCNLLRQTTIHDCRIVQPYYDAIFPTLISYKLSFWVLILTANGGWYWWKIGEQQGKKLWNDGLNMMTFKRRLKFVNIYTFVNVNTCKHVHGPSSSSHTNRPPHIPLAVHTKYKNNYAFI